MTKNYDVRDVNSVDNWTNEKWVADLLKIKPNTLRKQRSVGKNFIPYHKIGGSVRYNKLEVQEYLDNRLRRSANDWEGPLQFTNKAS